MEALFLLIQPFLTELIAVGGILLAILVAFFSGKSKGKAQEQTKQLKESYNAERTRNEVENNVRSSSESKRQRLRNKWFRK